MLKGYNPICGKVKGVQPCIYVLSIKAATKTGLSLWQSEDKTMWGQSIFPGSPPFKSHVYTVSHFSYAPLIKCKISRKRNVIFLF